MSFADGCHDAFLKLLKAAAAMLNKRALSVFSLAVVTLILITVTSRSLRDWSFHGNGYTHMSGSKPNPPNFNKPDDTAHVVAPTRPPAPDERPGASQTSPPAAKGIPATEDIPFRPHDPACDSFPDTSSVLLVMKTGATESYNKVPTQVMTMLKCLPEYFIFSDHDEVIAGHHIRDSLDTVLDSTRIGNNDFALYDRQKQCAIDQESCNKLAGSANEGWNLDKYKNVHIAEKVYKLRPNYDWYLFVDADTYVLFPTLMQWLPSLDPSKHHYLGSTTMLRGYGFAHGGSGYLVSQTAMKALGDHPGIANELEPVMSKECCGDYVFGLSLDNTSSTRVRNMWPTINGEKPFTLPYGPREWCQPLVTMHHMNSEEISSFWEWEVKRYADPGAARNPPITRIKDVFEAFMKPRLRAQRENWDNKAGDRFYLVETPDGRQFSESEKKRTKHDDEELSEIEKKAHESPKACEEACKEDEGCFSWRWQDGLCGVSWTFQMGTPMKQAKVERMQYTSGWIVERIEEFSKKHENCDKVTFPKVT